MEPSIEELDTWRKTAFDRLVARRWLPPTLATIARSNTGRRDIQLHEIRSFLIAVVAAAETDSPAWGEQSISHPAVIREVFGLTNKSVNCSVRQRQELAGHAVGRGVSWHTIRKYAHAHVTRLSTWINDHDLDTKLTSTNDLDPELAIRQDDLAWLRASYNQLHRGGVLLLWGLSGTGKTTLARYFSRHLGPRSATGFVRLGRQGVLEEDIRQVLRLEGHDVSRQSDDQCAAIFRTVVKHLNKVRLLVFDGAHSDGEITALIPNGCKTPILITSQRKLDLHHIANGEETRKRQLTTISPQQSTDYLLSQVPESSRPAMELLARHSGGHFETLNLMIKYLNDQGSPGADLLISELESDLSNTFINLAEVLDVSPSLPRIVGLLLREVDDPLTIAILGSLTWVGHREEASKELIAAVAGVLHHRPSKLGFQASFKRLDRLGLAVDTKSHIRISRSVAEILRGLLADMRTPVLLAYERVLSNPPDRHAGLTLLQILRYEYRFLEHLRQDLLKVFTLPKESSVTLLPLDSDSWMIATTEATGERHITLLRIASRSLLQLKPHSSHWEPVPDPIKTQIVDVLSAVLPTIEAGWAKS